MATVNLGIFLQLLYLVFYNIMKKWDPVKCTIQLTFFGIIIQKASDY